MDEPSPTRPWQVIVIAVWNFAIVAAVLVALIYVFVAQATGNEDDGPSAAFGRAFVVFLVLYVAVVAAPLAVVRLLAGILLLRGRRAGQVLAILGSVLGALAAVLLVEASNGKTAALLVAEVVAVVLLVQRPIRAWLAGAPRFRRTP